jgi:putative ABC transport system permease protein
VPLVPVRLLLVNGKPVESIEQAGRRRYFRRTRQVTWSEPKPDELDVRRGVWWMAGDQTPAVSVSEETASALKVEPGMMLRWLCVDREFNTRVAAIHLVKSVRPGQSDDFIFNRTALDGLPVQWFGAVRMAPNRVAVLQREAYQRFPTVTVINAADVLSIVQEVVDQAAMVVRFISAFAIIAGSIILASTVAGTRLRRTREAAVLKTLGGRRRRLVEIFSVEFAILGAVAGLMGGALATVFSRLLLIRLLDARLSFDLLPNLATVLLTAALAIITGWLASVRILRERPLEVLRHE